MSIVRSLTPLLILIVCAGLGLESASAQIRVPDGKEDAKARYVEVYELEHLSPNSAQNILRSNLETRHVSQEANANRLIVTGTNELQQAVASLLESIDVAPPRWNAEIILGIGGREISVRQIHLSDEGTEIVGNRGSERDVHVKIRLESLEQRTDQVDVEYQIVAQLVPVDDKNESLYFSEKGKATLDQNGLFSLIRLEDERHQRLLASGFGIDGKADTLSFRVKR